MEGEEDYFDGEELLYTGDLEEALKAMENSRRTATESRSTSARDNPSIPTTNTTSIQPMAIQSEAHSVQASETSNAGASSMKRSTSPPHSTEYTDAAMYQPTGFGEIGNFMRNKRLKLGMQHRAMLEDEGEHEERRQIFKGLHVYINGLTNDGNTSDIGLRQLVEELVKHGGTHVSYLDKKSLITHYVASNLTKSKLDEFRSIKYKVATPNWLTDSIAAKRLLDWNRYSLYAVSSEPTQPRFLDDERLGNSNGQQSLFGMGIGKAVADGTELKDLKGKKKEVLPSNQNMESLGERGMRLVESVRATAAAKPTANTSFFAAKPLTKTTNQPRPTSPSKAPKVSSIWDDFDHDPNAPHPYLPTVVSNRSDAVFSDPKWLAENTSQNPTFLANYFAQSRLSHLSLWKEELKNHVAKLQPNDERPTRAKKLTGLPSDRRVIMHVDFDCFFVSAGLTSRPELKGKPVAVCHSDGGVGSTSEIASCSYEARAMGVASTMSFGKARELCPDIVPIPFEFDLYRKISSQMYTILLSHAKYLQAISVDEVLIEVELPDSSSSSPDPALHFAHQIRDEVRQATGCEVSVGISHNILLAKLATRKAKPASAYHLHPEDVERYITPLSIDALPGIAWRTTADLKEKLNIPRDQYLTIGEMAKLSEQALKKLVGETNGSKFFSFARGVDARELEGRKPRQSVEVAVNYGIRFSEESQVKVFFDQLAEEISSRLVKENYSASSFVLKVMRRLPDASVITPKFLGHGIVSQHSSSTTIAGPRNSSTNDASILAAAAWKLLGPLAIPVEDLRGIAFQCQKLKQDGVVVAGVRERGQGVLAFGPVAKVSPDLPLLDEVVPPVSSPAVPFPPPGQTRTKRHLQEDPPSVIILGDTDSDSTPPPPKKVKRSTSKSKSPSKSPTKVKVVKPKAPVIPAIFKASSRRAAPSFPSASQVSDAHLFEWGLDAEVYRALPTADQEDALRQVRTSSLALQLQASRNAANPDQTTIRGKVTKASLRSGLSKSVSQPPPSSLEPSPAVVVSSSPMPVSDEIIRSLNYDPRIFHQLPPSVQQEILKDNRAVKKTFTVAGDRQSSKTRVQSRYIHLVPFTPALPPKFAGKTEVEEIRTAIESWFEKCKKAGPANVDVKKFMTYLEKSCDANRRGSGRDWSKVRSLLIWWEFLIESEFGGEKECEAGFGRVWWDAWKRGRARVDAFVTKEFGSGASLSIG